MQAFVGCVCHDHTVGHGVPHDLPGTSCTDGGRGWVDEEVQVTIVDRAGFGSGIVLAAGIGVFAGEIGFFCLRPSRPG